MERRKKFRRIFANFIRIGLWLVFFVKFGKMEILRPVPVIRGGKTEICFDSPLSNSLMESEIEDNIMKTDFSKKEPFLSYHQQENYEKLNNQISKRRKKNKKNRKCYSLTHYKPEHIQFQIPKKNIKKFSIPITFNTDDTVFSLNHDFRSIFSNDQNTSDALKKLNFNIISPSAYHSQHICPICLKKFSNVHYKNLHLAYKHVNLGMMQYDYNILSFVDLQIRQETRLKAQLGLDFDESDRIFLCKKIVFALSSLEIDCDKYFKKRLNNLDIYILFQTMNMPRVAFFKHPRHELISNLARIYQIKLVLGRSGLST